MRVSFHDITHVITYSSFFCKALDLLCLIIFYLVDCVYVSGFFDIKIHLFNCDIIDLAKIYATC